MNFLLNMNLPRELGERLSTQGHAYRHLRNIGMAQAKDIEVVAEARRNGEIILTHDLHYGHLLAFSGESTPSVVIFRLRDTHPDNLLARMTGIWSQIEAPLTQGAIIIIEDSTLRIRRLPIE